MLAQGRKPWAAQAGKIGGSRDERAPYFVPTLEGSARGADSCGGCYFSIILMEMGPLSPAQYRPSCGSMARRGRELRPRLYCDAGPNRRRLGPTSSPLFWQAQAFASPERDLAAIRAARGLFIRGFISDGAAVAVGCAPVASPSGRGASRLQPTSSPKVG